MIFSDQPKTVTLVANPPPETDNGGLDQAFQLLSARGLRNHQISRVASVSDIDVALGSVVTASFKGTVRLQIIGHAIPGSICLGARWTDTGIHDPAAFAFPFLVLDTNPVALGLLAKYAGKLSEVMLVGCHVGSTTSFGHAINGRTLTYTLAELLRCKVCGADDDVAPDEYDEQGWYAPAPSHRRPKGWRWSDASPPLWTDPGTDPLPRNRKPAARDGKPVEIEIRAVRTAMLPLLTTQEPVVLPSPIHVTCQYVTSAAPMSALPELAVETDQGPAQLVGGGRYLKIDDVCYVIDRSPALVAALTGMLRCLDTALRALCAPTSAAG
ncbi:MAG TPA: hypothetical protein VHT91_34140 [Kofleriaceae bacterium]|jgi:hypothetical protein|nr:hypothetical protein [Kofleriaceae bacterium]